MIVEFACKTLHFFFCQCFFATWPSLHFLTPIALRLAIDRYPWVQQAATSSDQSSLRLLWLGSAPVSQGLYLVLALPLYIVYGFACHDL